MNEQQNIKDYYNLLTQEYEAIQKQISETLAIVKSLVNDNYYEAITNWIKDEENGIWGRLKIVSAPIGEWQDESEESSYWDEIKGVYIEQYVGSCGDDYSGYLTIKLTDEQYLQACFQL